MKLVNGQTGHADLDWLYTTVSRLAQQANLPMPEVGYYDSPEVNAFATGPSRSKSLVAVSSGLLSNMRREETEGVLAHELAHIQNGDMVTMTLIQGVVNAFVLYLSRVIAGIVRNAVDERYAYDTRLRRDHRPRHPAGHSRHDDRRLVLAGAGIPRRCRRGAASPGARR